MNKSDPALANDSIHFYGSDTIKCVSRNAAYKCFLKDFTTHEPIVIFGTKCPSITSICNQSAPYSKTSLHSSANVAKSADNIEGDTIILLKRNSFLLEVFMLLIAIFSYLTLITKGWIGFTYGLSISNKNLVKLRPIPPIHSFFQLFAYLIGIFTVWKSQTVRNSENVRIARNSYNFIISDF